MARSRPSTDRQNRVAAILIVGGSLLVAAAAVASLLSGGTTMPHAAHRDLAGIARAVVPGSSIFLLGCVFLINRPQTGEAAPETLPWLQRPRIRRRLAYAYFALSAALILLNLYRGI
jgi:hypothetical protein